MCFEGDSGSYSTQREELGKCFLRNMRRFVLNNAHSGWLKGCVTLNADSALGGADNTNYAVDWDLFS